MGTSRCDGMKNDLLKPIGGPSSRSLLGANRLGGRAARSRGSVAGKQRRWLSGKKNNIIKEINII